MFIVVTGFIGLSVVNPLKRVSMSNQECKIRPIIMNINSDKPSFYYSYSIFVNKCSGSCNDINDPYAKLCVPDETRHNNFGIIINADVNAKT